MDKKQEKHLDELFREYIRKRAMYRVHGCERCKSWKQNYKELQTAHCFTRGGRTTRWDIRNAVGICGGCHLYIDSHEDAKFALFREAIGDSKEFEMLYVLSKMTTKQAPVDYNLMAIYLKELIKRLDGVVATT